MTTLIPLAFLLSAVFLLVISVIDKAELEASNLEQQLYTPPSPEPTTYHTWADLMPKEQ